MMTSIQSKFEEKVVEYCERFPKETIIINNEEYSDKTIFKRESKCQFTCLQCNNNDTRVIRNICEKNGFVCKDCILFTKTGKICWNPDRIYRYFNFHIIKYNICAKKIRGSWEIPDYYWWRKYHSQWAGSLSREKINFQTLLKTHNSNTRLLKANTSEEELLSIFLKIYEDSGIEVLTPSSLDKNYGSIYSKHISQVQERYEIDKIESLFKDGNNDEFVPSGGKGIPSYWICEKLDLLDERYKYVKDNNLRMKTTEELETIVKFQRNTVFGNHTQISSGENANSRSDYTPEMRELYRRDPHKYTVYKFRNLLGFPHKHHPTNDGKYIMKSLSELHFYHRALEYNGISKICYEVKGIYVSQNSSIDFVFELNDGRKIGIEVWNFKEGDFVSKGSHFDDNRIKDYLVTRMEKESRWEQIEKSKNIKCYGIEYQDVHNNTKMCGFFENKLNLTINPEYKPVFVVSIRQDEEIKNELKKIHDENGYLDTDLYSHLRKKLCHYGGSTLKNVCNLIGIDFHENHKNKWAKGPHSKAMKKKEKERVFESMTKCLRVYENVEPNKYGKRRINMPLFKKIEKQCWGKNCIFQNFDELINYFNDEYDEENFILAEKKTNWNIGYNIENKKYYLYSKKFEDYIEEFKNYKNIKKDNNPQFHYTTAKGYKLGNTTNTIRSDYKKNKIPIDYLDELEKLEMIWSSKNNPNSKFFKQ